MTEPLKSRAPLIEKQTPIIRAAQYLRKSTDHQKYSTENQSIANHAYALRHGMEIVRTYADEGRSGLTFHRRKGLKKLIGDVQNGNVDFAVILVYDVSRWGRFQDADESGYYEYICKRVGINVHYTAELFDNTEGGPFVAILKNIKRAMAGEYSRDLSVKSFAGQANIFRRGFRVGAIPGYGTRRLLVDHTGTPRMVLSSGQYKALNADRVVLTLGPPEEIRIVKWIFSAFVKRKLSVSTIVKVLNKKGIASGTPRPWTYARVKKILQNEVYIGNDIWNRTSIRLGRRKAHNPPDQWLRTKCSFGPIIGRRRFQAAQALIRRRQQRLSEQDHLNALRRLSRRHGFLDSRLIAESDQVPSLTYIHAHFGGLRRLYKLIGSQGRPGAVMYGLSNDELLQRLRRLLKRRGRLTEVIIDNSRIVPSAGTYQIRFGSLKRAYELIGYKAGSRSHQGKLAKTNGMSDNEILESLRALLRKEGYLTERMIDQRKETPTSPTYIRRFGSLARTYELIGYTQTRGPGRGALRSARKVDDCHCGGATLRSPTAPGSRLHERGH